MKAGDLAIISTSDMFFPGFGVIHETRILEVGQKMVKVRGSKKRLGFLWEVHHDLWIDRSTIFDVIEENA